MITSISTDNDEDIEGICEANFLSAWRNLKPFITTTRPGRVTTQIKEVLRSETYIMPTGLQIRDTVSSVRLAPLSTEQVQRSFVYNSPLSYLRGIRRVDRLHVVLMTNLRVDQIALNEDVFVESPIRNDR